MRDQVKLANSLPLNAGKWLFPTSEGLKPSKVGWCKAFEQVAITAGEELTTKDGNARFTGHSARASGAFHLAKSNVDLWRIQLFGRWQSAAFLRYVRDSPLANLNQLASEASLSQSIENARRELQLLKRCSREEEQQLAVVDLDMLEDQPIPQTPEVEGAANYVCNNNSRGKIHRIWIRSESVHPRHWRAKCGWYFGKGLTDYQMHVSIPPGIQCKACFGLKKHPKDRSDSSSSSSSS